MTYLRKNSLDIFKNDSNLMKMNLKKEETTRIWVKNE